MADGQKVGVKNGSIFREYLKTSKECQSEYNRDISKYKVTNKSISEVNSKYANGIDINKFKVGAGLDTKITLIGKPPMLGYSKYNR
jgi:hypothetical protein